MTRSKMLAIIHPLIELMNPSNQTIGLRMSAFYASHQSITWSFNNCE